MPSIEWHVYRMRTSTACILVVIVFFALTLRAIQVDERRKGDRRKEQVRIPEWFDVRKTDRRKPTVKKFLVYKLKSIFKYFH